MSDRKPGSAAPTREERLAAALRENLRRRKAQSRGRAAGGAEAGQDAPPGGPAETAPTPRGGGA